MDIVQRGVLEIDEYLQVIDSVFGTMLDVAIEGCDRPMARADLATAVVYFAGSWPGAMLLQCDVQAACTITGRLMRFDPPPNMDDDVRDSLAEISNMIAGNLKAVLPHGATVSIPAIFEGSNFQAPFPTKTEIHADFTCCGHSFSASLLEFSGTNRETPPTDRPACPA